MHILFPVTHRIRPSFALISGVDGHQEVVIAPNDGR
jgi:hypothetical protein